MKILLLLVYAVSTKLLVFAQFGDAYHAPNTAQLEANRQSRMATNDAAHYANMRSGNKTSSGVGNISGDYNAFGWADYSGIRKQEAAGQRQQARIDEYDAKVKKLNMLIANRKLKISGEYYAALVKAAKEAGFEDFQINRFYGSNGNDLDRMQLNARIEAIKSQPGECQGSCSEIITLKNGDTYTGNTKGGFPHGKGKYTSKATGAIMEGDFEYGMMSGIIIIKGKNYTDSGAYKNEIITGLHRIVMDEGNGITGTYFINHDNLENTEYNTTDGMVFKGKTDHSGNFLKGTCNYPGGVKFTGYFKNNSPYRGSWIKEYRVMVGEFARDQNDALYLKYGFLDNQKDKIIYQGNFAPGMKRIGFINQESANGTVTEFYYSAPDVEEYVCIYFASGTKMYLKARADGEDYIGVQNLKDDNAASMPVRYSKKEGVIYLKTEEKELIEKSSQYAKEAIAKMKQGQADYNKALENVAEFFK